MNAHRQAVPASGPQTRSGAMSSLASAVTQWTGSNFGFGSAALIIVVWAVTGPIFHWSDTWQLVINTGTTIVTFLMVFLIQRSQNKDGLAIQLKLNELVAAIKGASNRLIDVEDLSEEELQILRRHYQRLAELDREDAVVATSHSMDKAERRHAAKRHASEDDPLHHTRTHLPS
jgi:low affinity Fe/Cu permease